MIPCKLHSTAVLTVLTAQVVKADAKKMCAGSGGKTVSTSLIVEGWRTEFEHLSAGKIDTKFRMALAAFIAKTCNHLQVTLAFTCLPAPLSLVFAVRSYLSLTFDSIRRDSSRDSGRDAGAQGDLLRRAAAGATTHSFCRYNPNTIAFVASMSLTFFSLHQNNSFIGPRVLRDDMSQPGKAFCEKLKWPEETVNAAQPPPCRHSRLALRFHACAITPPTCILRPCS